MSKKSLFLYFLLLIFILFVILINNQILIVLPKNEVATIGIIDAGDIKRNNIVYCNCRNDSEFGHGNSMVEFALQLDNSLNIYYYNASVDGEISNQQIISGIEWMMDNKVTFVNISLSSIKKSEEVRETIDNFIEKGGVIFASYNNKKSTFDYPAQYTNVRGVGMNDIHRTKKGDKLFRTNKLIILNKFYKIYEGNSYLSIYETIKHAIRGENEK